MGFIFYFFCFTRSQIQQYYLIVKKGILNTPFFLGARQVLSRFFLQFYFIVYLFQYFRQIRQGKFCQVSQNRKKKESRQAAGFLFSGLNFVKLAKFHRKYKLDLTGRQIQQQHRKICQKIDSFLEIWQNFSIHI
eukprot:TRINITY_DN43952_c0_g1_i3.p3 TRINITY_DN43952_c0_g1~~TRINITY_DN43952_c0_g1_i3.p3  ORF type:complete len:134 (+),score=2.10 TRINITY_DN43952_c0_g1_i3:113-514(+)